MRDWRGCGWRGPIGVLALYSFVTVYAAAPVEESVSEDVVRSGDTVAAGPSGDTASTAPSAERAPDDASQSGNQLGQLFYQLQLIRDEVQRLNGALEEQQNQIERLGREQQERYRNLDARVAELSDAAAERTVDDGPILPGTDAAPPPPQPGGTPTERDAYETAYELMDRDQLEVAAEAFQQLIEQYPNGQYTPNAYYWLGQLHQQNGDFEAARQSFVQVVALYPDHNKVPDALFKLGIVYAQLDEPERAMEYLDQVMREYPDSTAASLAEQYAAELR